MRSAAFSFGGRIKAHGHHHGIGVRGDGLGFRADQVFGTHNTEIQFRLSPTALDEVIELNLVRTGRQRHFHLAQKRICLRPVVDHQLLVDIQTVTAVFAGALNENQVVTRSAGREISCPANRQVIRGHAIGGPWIVAGLVVYTLDARLAGKTRVVEELSFQTRLASVRFGGEVGLAGKLRQRRHSSRVVHLGARCPDSLRFPPES